MKSQWPSQASRARPIDWAAPHRDRFDPHPYQVDHGVRRHRPTIAGPRLVVRRVSALFVAVRVCWCQPLMSEGWAGLTSGRLGLPPETMLLHELDEIVHASLFHGAAEDVTRGLVAAIRVRGLAGIQSTAGPCVEATFGAGVKPSTRTCVETTARPGVKATTGSRIQASAWPRVRPAARPCVGTAAGACVGTATRSGVHAAAGPRVETPTGTGVAISHPSLLLHTPSVTLTTDNQEALAKTQFETLGAALLAA